ncbi:uncharacterized protein YndB with AHSA1/START domain [Tamaricihabitans halophyticus]|uniref:Uncharacterized protein YndB with AHSA1/START domain n=1 Tax=Tamaricihabitans halophyticus TaxID=1262583 RepID=A0A4R2QZV2_9PSEU|nr:SRPBCC family protein [Tamaricihabitans halophyticus]TCP55237.1 uncharacterized protein YndB with AHSA1/START domain [Tamaricihabitans halophyticus]
MSTKQQLSAVGERSQLRIERRFAHPREKVWSAITEPEHFFAWYPMASGTIDPRPSGALEFDDGEGTTYRGEVLEFDPPKVFAFREEQDELRFELSDDGAGCLLVFTHTFADRAWAAHTAAGWHRCLDVLETRLTGEASELPDNGAELRAHYAKLVRS